VHACARLETQKKHTSTLDTDPSSHAKGSRNNYNIIVDKLHEILCSHLLSLKNASSSHFPQMPGCIASMRDNLSPLLLRSAMVNLVPRGLHRYHLRTHPSQRNMINIESRLDPLCIAATHSQMNSHLRLLITEGADWVAGQTSHGKSIDSPISAPSR
jgi:hypothetical protein